jgi:hypothetical protein
LRDWILANGAPQTRQEAGENGDPGVKKHDGRNCP